MYLVQSILTGKYLISIDRLYIFSHNLEQARMFTEVEAMRISMHMNGSFPPTSVKVITLEDAIVRYIMES